ncbi:MAG: hypothetical protein R8P61_16425 [Bacteroidia bacterium]|nr:hypothetical protein [Bacteroidia bacterium]
MKLLVLRFCQIIVTVMLFLGQPVFSQSYTNSLFPEHLTLVHNQSRAIVWGCEYCLKPLSHKTELDWVINFEPPTDSVINLIDSLVLDFGRTPGFSFNELILTGNYKILSNTKLLIKEGRTVVKGIKQIEINKLDSSLYESNKQEVLALSHIVGKRRLLPVIADIKLVPRILDSENSYKNFIFNIEQLYKAEKVGNYSIEYEFKDQLNSFFFPGYTENDYTTLKSLISLLGGDGARSCISRMILPFSIPLLGILIPVPRPFYFRSLICVEATPFNMANPLPNPDNYFYRPTLSIDGYDSNGNHLNDNLYWPFHYIESNNPGKVIYFFNVPNLQSDRPNTELFIYNRKNQLCHVTLNSGLNGSYYISLKPRHEPVVKLFNVTPMGISIDRSSKISSEFGLAACNFERYQTGINLRGVVNNAVITNVDDDNLMEQLSSLIYHASNPRRPLIERQFKNTFSLTNHFVENALNVYYLHPPSTISALDDNNNPITRTVPASRRGVYIFENIIIIDVRNAISETLTHEFGHSFGLEHIGASGVLDCEYNSISNVTVSDNFMNSGAVGRFEFTLGQITRMNIKPYSSLILNGLRLNQACRACEEWHTDTFYRYDKECPCVGLNN